ncbi:MAG: hypothetical protein JW759_10050 [Candidatus Coatesbacteria bacterium]|nr:hypothetical protein [Candidatus Coatesbacteria bacterium]
MQVSRPYQIVISALVLAAAVTALHLSNASTDDAFITFRYAGNLAAGNGLVFNPGERVEGYSNFLWANLLSLLMVCGLTGFAHGVLVWSKALGLFFALLCFPLIYKAGRSTALEDAPALIGLVAPMLLLASAQFIGWAVGGLETAMCAFLVLMAQHFSLRVVAGRDEERRPILRPFCLASLFYLLASLTRPEIPILFAAAFLTTFVHQLRHGGIRAKELVLSAGTFTLPYVGFLTWRLLYYGDIFPNTFYAKATGGGEMQLWDGVKYWSFGLSTILGPFLLLCFLPLVLRSPKGSRREASRSRYWFLLWQLVAMSCFIIYSGGDWMGSYRLFIPILPALALMAQSGADELWSRLSKVERGAILKRRLATAMVVLAVALFGYHIADSMLVAKKPSGFTARDLLNQEYYQVAKMLRQWIRPGTAVALGEAGLIPYYSGLDVIDCRGLTDRYIARLEGKAHAKFEPMYIFHRKPDYVVLVDVTGSTWSEHNYQNMLLDHQVLSDDYKPAGGSRLRDMFWKYRFLLMTRKGPQFGSRLD